MLRSSGNSDSDVLDDDDNRRDKEAGAVQLGRQHLQNKYFCQEKYDLRYNMFKKCR